MFGNASQILINLMFNINLFNNMAENIGKRAQQEREKRLRESDEAVRAKVNSLSYIANEIEENFSIIKHLINVSSK